MKKILKPAKIEKFMDLESHKRDRIINAALKEFCCGYEKASTDVIVRDAGISKGLLFYYFGSKCQLYEFMIAYAKEATQLRYFDMINLNHKNILEGVWQMVLLKKDVLSRHPAILDFMKKVNDRVGYGTDTSKSDYIQPDLDALYNQCDTSLFRQDINPQKVIDIIWRAMNGFLKKADAKLPTSSDERESQNYERFLENLRGYLDIFQLCFYKKEEFQC